MNEVTNAETKTVEVEDLAQWSDGKTVLTPRGERLLRTAEPTDQFRAAWKANKPAMQAMGLGWSKHPQTDVWKICWWQSVQPEATADKIEAVLSSAATNAQIEIPAPKGHDYLGYQKAGIAYALARPGTLIGDEMGLGKTIQGIGVINADTSIKSVLIVCPVTLKLNWYRELKKWLTRPMTIGILEGKSCKTSADIAIINFDILHRAPAVVEKTYDLVIVDEIHKIKNGATLRAKAVMKVKGRRRIGMTGTPILNGKPIELFTSLNWLDPQYWAGKKGFYARRYCNAHQSQFGWDDTGASNLDELNTLLRSKWMVRRLKKDVLKDLPAKVRQVIEIEADKKIQAVIAAELNKWERYETALDTAEDEVVKAKMDDNQDAYEEAVAKLKAARRVAFEEMAAVRHATSVAKAPYVAEFIAEMLDDKEGKIVVFAHHKDVVEILMDTLKEFHPVKVTGDVTAKGRDEAVNAFQNDSKCRVFVGNIQAAGVGLTLTAASHVIFAELDWVPANVTQAEDRCHRIGQLGSVLCQHIVLAGSLDAKMSRTIVSKQRIADQALDKKVAVSAPAELAPKVNGHSVTVPGKLTVTVPVQQQEAIIPIEKVQAAHQAMKMLAGICNGAVSLDEMGFNKLDTKFGKDLASRASLSQKQAKYAVMLARKYKRQLPTQILSVIGVEK